MNLVWEEAFDDNDNSSWRAGSPYRVAGRVIWWRLKQRLRENRIEWYAAHDAELSGDCEGILWLSLDEAKEATEVAHAEILNEL